MDLQGGSIFAWVAVRPCRGSAAPHLTAEPAQLDCAEGQRSGRIDDDAGANQHHQRGAEPCLSGSFHGVSHLQIALAHGRIGGKRGGRAAPYNMPFFDHDVPVGKPLERVEVLVD